MNCMRIQNKYDFSNLFLILLYFLNLKKSRAVQSAIRKNITKDKKTLHVIKELIKIFF